MTRADVLRDAATLVRERGLARGTVEDAEGRLCAVGAITEACKTVDFHKPSMAAAAVLTVFLGPSVVCIPRWSDNALDAEEVAATMEKAAAWWEEET